MTSDEPDDQAPTPLPFDVPATLTRPPSAAHLRTQVLPTLWHAWTAAAAANAEDDHAGDDARARLLGAFDAAVVALASEARAQGATVTAIVRLLSIVDRAAEEEVEQEGAPRGRRGLLLERAGRVAMAAYYRAPEA